MSMNRAIGEEPGINRLGARSTLCHFSDDLFRGCISCAHCGRGRLKFGQKRARLDVTAQICDSDIVVSRNVGSLLARIALHPGGAGSPSLTQIL